MQLAYSAEWQDHNEYESSIAIGDYRGETRWVTREGGFRWSAWSGDDRIDMGREEDSGDARDAVEEAIRRRHARTVR